MGAKAWLLVVSGLHAIVEEREKVCIYIADCIHIHIYLHAYDHYYSSETIHPPCPSRTICILWRGRAGSLSLS
jgi:hypothetical protein